MIGTSVDTGAFAEVPTSERFVINPSTANPMVVTDAMELTRFSNVTNVVAMHQLQTSGIAPVDKTLDEIIGNCERDVGANPNSSRPHVNLAIALLNRGRKDTGIIHLETALKLSPNDYVALNLLAGAHFSTGDLDLAGELYSRIIELFPFSSAPYMGLASIALRRDDFLNAARHLEKALGFDPKLAAASVLLAMVHFKLGKPHRAIAILRSALRQEDKSPELNQALAFAFLLSGDLKRSERAFHTALALNPNLGSAIYGLAFLWMQQRKIDETIALLSRRLDNVPSDMQSRELLAQAFVTVEHYKLARTQFAHLLEQKVPDLVLDQEALARINNNLGYCLAMEGNHREAERRLVNALKHAPSFAVQPYANLARVYFSEGRFSYALSTIDAALASGFDVPDLHLMREVCLVNLDRYQEAITELQGVINTGDAPPAAYADLGWLLAEWTANYDAAVSVLNRGLDKWNTDLIILNNLAYVHLLKGETEPARYLLDLIHAPNSPFILATEGLLMLHEGKIDAGDQRYRRAEEFATRIGDSPLALAIRQKRLLEVAKAHFRAGAKELALDLVEKGLLVQQVSTPFPFVHQLNKLKLDLNKSTET